MIRTSANHFPDRVMGVADVCRDIQAVDGTQQPWRATAWLAVIVATRHSLLWVCRAGRAPLLLAAVFAMQTWPDMPCVFFLPKTPDTTITEFTVRNAVSMAQRDPIQQDFDLARKLPSHADSTPSSSQLAETVCLV